MNNYYDVLAESMIKKYTTPLNEAWGNIPDWMKSSLERGLIDGEKMKNSKIYQKAYADAEASGSYNPYAEARDAWEKSKGVSSYEFADYRKPRNDFSSTSEKSLFAQFKAHGIDLNNPNMKFIEGEPPKSNKDPRLQPPNIGIWYIPSRMGRAYDQVYAKGINDLEKPYLPTVNAPDRAFVSIPLKTMAEISSKFCYLDGSTIESRDYDDLRDKRNTNNTNNKYAQYYGKERIPEKERGKFYGATLDKSGYVVIPSSQKYADELEKLKLKKWATELKNIEDKLNSLFSGYQQALSTMDVVDTDYSFVTSSRHFLDYFYHAVDYYKGALRVIDEIKSTTTVDSKEFLSKLKTSNFKGYLTTSDNNIKQAEIKFKDYMLSEIDI